MNILLLGDMGSKGTSQNIVAKSMEKLVKANDIKFVCGLGDNIYEYGVESVKDEKFKTHFENPYKNIKLKFYMCLGNHDYGKKSIDGSYSDNFKQNSHLYDFTIERTPMKKWGESRDVANACLYLASNLSDYVTGEVLNVDGGWSAW